MNRFMDKILSGRYALLMAFGLTLCFLTSISLTAIIFLHDGKKIELLASFFTTLLGFVAGSFNRMWDNYNHRQDRKTGGENEESVVTSSSNDGNSIVTIKS